MSTLHEPRDESHDETSSGPATAAEASSEESIALRFKHALLKAIDVTALGFLEPVVRLCYGEEPRVQLRNIARLIVLPTVAFVLFLGVWAVTAPNLRTKYGALPTPSQVWDGWCAIMTFHEREMEKSEAYLAEGPEREAIVAEATARLQLLERASKVANERVATAREREQADKEARLTPLRAELEAFESQLEAETEERFAAVEAMSTTHPADDRAVLVRELAKVAEWTESQEEIVARMKASMKEIEDEKSPALVAALHLQTSVAEEKQFTEKLIQVAGAKSREVKLNALVASIREDQAAHASADPDSAYELAHSIAKDRARLEDVVESTYPRPWTLPMQIVRSILTVFSGFLIGVAIAIPLGILCGLSSTFMAMVTPFIALFKPVSPIVWLLIFWIVVGGVFPDPASSQTLQVLNYLANSVLSVTPYVGSIVDDIDINPAFIASALTVATCSLWATMVNTALGVASVDQDHVNVARVLKLSPYDRLVKIVLPSALPLVFAGMRISLGIGWMVLIAAELLASSEGLGKFTNDMFQNGNTDSFAKIMVMVFVVGVIGLVLDRIMIVFQRLVSFEGSVATV